MARSDELTCTPTVDTALRKLVREVVLDVVRVVVREELAVARPEPASSSPPLRETTTSSPRAVQFLSIKDVAGAVHVVERTVRGWVKTGKLRASRAGRLMRIERAELERFLAGEGSNEHRDVDIDALATDLMRRRRK